MREGSLRKKAAFSFNGSSRLTCLLFGIQAGCHQSMTNCGPGFERRNDKHRLSELFPGCTRFHGVLDMRVDTVAALGRQGHRDGDQLAVLVGNFSIFAFGSGLQMEKAAASCGAAWISCLAKNRSSEGLIGAHVFSWCPVSMGASLLFHDQFWMIALSSVPFTEISRLLPM